MITQINPKQFISMPWKNGMGITWELARQEALDGNAFSWRISIAEVGTDGPFSLYQGYQRIIGTLEGEGMLLEVDKTSAKEVGRFELFAFSGSSEVNCSLVKGAIRDFNIIYRPDLCRVRAQWLNSHSPSRFISSATCTFIYAVQAISVTQGEYAATIEAGAACLVENRDNSALDWTVAGKIPNSGVTCCCVEINNT